MDPCTHWLTDTINPLWKIKIKIKRVNLLVRKWFRRREQGINRQWVDFLSACKNFLCGVILRVKSLILAGFQPECNYSQAGKKNSKYVSYVRVFCGLATSKLWLRLFGISYWIKRKFLIKLNGILFDGINKLFIIIKEY